MTTGKRSMRGQLLMGAVTSAMISASKDDYLNAVTDMIAAAHAADYRLPPKPYGWPDVVRGDTWKAWRSFYHKHFPTVYEHVNNVLKQLSQGSMEVVEEGEEVET